MRSRLGNAIRMLGQLGLLVLAWGVFVATDYINPGPTRIFPFEGQGCLKPDLKVIFQSYDAFPDDFPDLSDSVRIQTADYNYVDSKIEVDFKKGRITAIPDSPLRAKVLYRASGIDLEWIQSRHYSLSSEQYFVRPHEVFFEVDAPPRILTMLPGYYIEDDRAMDVALVFSEPVSFASLSTESVFGWLATAPTGTRVEIGERINWTKVTPFEGFSHIASFQFDAKPFDADYSLSITAVEIAGTVYSDRGSPFLHEELDRNANLYRPKTSHIYLVPNVGFYYGEESQYLVDVKCAP